MFWQRCWRSHSGVRSQAAFSTKLQAPADYQGYSISAARQREKRRFGGKARFSFPDEDTVEAVPYPKPFGRLPNHP